MILRFLITTLLCSFYVNFSYSGVIPKFDFKKLNYHEKQRIVRLMQSFLVDVQKEQNLNNPKTVLMDFLNFKEAYASENLTCFFGGWPSEEISGKCSTPWSKSSSDYSSCGAGNKFRCNPVMFGPGSDGNGRCIDTNGSYNNVTSDCLDSSNSNADIDIILANIMKTPQSIEKFQKLAGQINQFCSRKRAQGLGSSFACQSLEGRMKALEDRSNEVREESANAIRQRNLEQQRALGILNSCQEHYEKENEGFLSSMTKSDRNIIAGIKDNYAKCAQSAGDTNSPDFDNFKNDLENIEEKIVPKDILEQTNIFAVDNTIKTLLMTKIQNGENFSKSSIMNELKDDHPNLIKDKNLKDLINKNVDAFNTPRVKNSIPKKSPALAANEFNQFGAKLNRICDEIRQEHKAIAGGWYRFDTNNAAEDELYSRKQAEIDTLLSEFRENNSYANLLNTESMRDDFFPYNADLAEDCAEDDTGLDKVFNTNVKAQDIKTANKELQELLLADFESVEDNVEALKDDDEDDIEDGIKDILKYKPFLMGQLMENAPADMQQTYAKYFCKHSLDIYDTDELWVAGEITLGAVAIVGAVAVNVIPGVGQLASGAIISSVATAGAVGIAGFEVAAASRRYMDGIETENATLAGLSTGQITSDRAAKELLRSTDAKSWALFDSAMAVTGLGGAARVLRVAAKTKAISNVKAGDELLVLNSKGEAVTAVAQEVTQTRIAKKPVVKIKVEGEETTRTLKESDMHSDLLLRGDSVSVNVGGKEVRGKIVGVQDGRAQVRYTGANNIELSTSVSASQVSRPVSRVRRAISSASDRVLTPIQERRKNAQLRAQALKRSNEALAQKQNEFKAFTTSGAKVSDTDRVKNIEDLQLDNLTNNKVLSAIYTGAPDKNKQISLLYEAGLSKAQVKTLQKSGTLDIDINAIENMMTVPPMNRANIVTGARASYPNADGFLEHASITKVDGDNVTIKTKRGNEIVKLIVKKSDLSQPILKSKPVIRMKDGKYDMYIKDGKILQGSVANYKNLFENISDLRLRPRAQMKTSGNDFSKPISDKQYDNYVNDVAKLEEIFRQMPERTITSEFTKANDELLTKMQNDLRAQGVSSNIQAGEQGVNRLVLTGASESANRVARMYLRSTDRLNSQALTVSPFENFKAGSNAFNMSDSSRLDMGVGVTLDLLRKRKNTTFAHEARHQMFNARQGVGQNSIFDHELRSNGATGLDGQVNASSGFYNDYMSLEEVYNHSSDGWNLGKGLKDLPETERAKRILEIQNKVSSANILADRTVRHTDNFLNELDDIFSPKEGYSFSSGGRIKITNSEGIELKMNLNLSDKALDSFDKFQKRKGTSYVDDLPNSTLDTYLQSEKVKSLAPEVQRNLAQIASKIKNGELPKSNIELETPNRDYILFLLDGANTVHKQNLLIPIKNEVAAELAKMKDNALKVRTKTEEVSFLDTVDCEGGDLAKCAAVSSQLQELGRTVREPLRESFLEASGQ